jgi:hypothetical protein
VDAVLRILSTHGEWIVASCALVVSLWTIAAQRHHNRLSVCPRLHITKGYTDTAPYIWHLRNFGVGPAVIKTFKVTIDGTELSFPTMGGLNAALNGLGCERFDECYGFRPGEYLQAGSEVILLSFPRDEADAIQHRLPRISWAIVYASIYGEEQVLNVKADT